MIMPLRAAVVAVAATIGCAGPDALHAQSYPARSVTLIVPSAAGGGTDTIARLIGDQLAKQLGQGFVVENRTGGGMLVGTTAAAKAAPDGYTLLVGLTGNMSVNPSVFAKLPYDPLADFTPVAMLARPSPRASRGLRPPNHETISAERHLYDALYLFCGCDPKKLRFAGVCAAFET
jgi:tripartite-type tricarboxylate transporter receptor subunit TctC